MSIEQGCTNATLMLIDERKVIEKPEGGVLLPTPHKLLDVCLNDNFLNQALEAQRKCLMQGEDFVIRLLGDDPLDPPVFAVAILTLPVRFGAIYTTGGPN